MNFIFLTMNLHLLFKYFTLVYILILELAHYYNMIIEYYCKALRTAMNKRYKNDILLLLLLLSLIITGGDK